MKKVDGYGQGDHYVTFKVVVPKTLSKEQKALIQAYAEIEKDTPGQIFGFTKKTDGMNLFLCFLKLICFVGGKCVKIFFVNMLCKEYCYNVLYLTHFSLTGAKEDPLAGSESKSNEKEEKKGFMSKLKNAIFG